MAYIYKVIAGWQGPFASKRGEWTGNSFESCVIPDDLKREGPFDLPTYGSCTYVGRAGATEFFSSDRLTAAESVGRYLRSDMELLSEGIEKSFQYFEVDTDELQEEVVTGQRKALKHYVLPDNSVDIEAFIAERARVVTAD